MTLPIVNCAPAWTGNITANVTFDAALGADGVANTTDDVPRSLRVDGQWEYVPLCVTIPELPMMMMMMEDGDMSVAPTPIPLGTPAPTPLPKPITTGDTIDVRLLADTSELVQFGGNLNFSSYLFRPFLIVFFLFDIVDFMVIFISFFMHTSVEHTNKKYSV